MASLKVIKTLWLTGTSIAPSFGLVLVMVGGFVSGGQMIKQTFTQIFNFLGGGIEKITDKVEDLTKPLKSIAGIGKKVKRLF